MEEWIGSEKNEDKNIILYLYVLCYESKQKYIE